MNEILSALWQGIKKMILRGEQMTKVEMIEIPFQTKHFNKYLKKLTRNLPKGI
jgi:hypothetical protein